MITTVTNFGDSLGVQFPKLLLKKERKKHITTKERIAAFCGTIDNVQASEIECGEL